MNKEGSVTVNKEGSVTVNKEGYMVIYSTAYGIQITVRWENLAGGIWQIWRIVHDQFAKPNHPN